MTPRQRTSYYMPKWSAAYRAIWRTEKGRIVRKPESVARLGWIEIEVTKIANNRARQEHRGLTADDLRHACVIATLGKDKSTHDLTWRETEHIICCFDCLKAGAEDLDETSITRIELEDLWSENPPLRLWKAGYIRMIRKAAPEAYILELARNIHRTIYWEELPFEKLEKFYRLIRARRSTKHEEP